MKGLGSLAIRDLEAIVVLARTLHFGRTAEICGIAQPSLTALVQRVEGKLGKKLFERTSRRCTATPEGIFVVEAIERLLRGLAELEREGPGETLAGPVRLGFIPTLGPYLVPHLLPALLQGFPDARFYFFEALTEQLLGMLRSGRIDAALLSFPTRGDALAEYPLFEEELVLAFPRRHRLARRGRIGHTEVPRSELILMDHGHCLRDHTLQVFGQGELSAAPVHATSVETLRFMVGAGVGFTVLPALAVPAGEGDGLVVYRRFLDPVPTRTVGLVTRGEAEHRRVALPLVEVLGKLELPKCLTGREVEDGGDSESAVPLPPAVAASAAAAAPA